MTSVVSVRVSTVSLQGTGAGSSPSTTLHSIKVQPVPFVAAKRLLMRHHYLHSLPGGTMLSFGVFLGDRLLGVITFGAGPQMTHSLVTGAKRGDCLALTRLWISDELPANSESRTLGVILRSLKRYTHIKFLVTYADPAYSHTGTIYQATGWLYTGLSEATPSYDVGDGKATHSRSFGQIYGSHSLKYLATRGVKVKVVPQTAKHRYIYFLDPSWRLKLRTQVLPYPKKESHENY